MFTAVSVSLCESDLLMLGIKTSPLKAKLFQNMFCNLLPVISLMKPQRKQKKTLFMLLRTNTHSQEKEDEKCQINSPRRWKDK